MTTLLSAQEGVRFLFGPAAHRVAPRDFSDRAARSAPAGGKAFRLFGYFGLFCSTVLILRVIVVVVRDGLS